MNFLKNSKLLKFARKYFGKIALKYYYIATPKSERGL